jgi:NAD(P)-dependent dehydrogenase (short-subunit alcohol dehydrogenase family)
MVISVSAPQQHCGWPCRPPESDAALLPDKTSERKIMTSPVTLITGASRGIGRGIAERLARDGHRIINLSRSKPGGSFPGESFAADLSDTEAASRILAEIVADREIDNLINNAGMIEVARLGDIDLKQVQRMIDLNLKVAMIATQAVLPDMRRKGRGRIVNIASRAIYGKSGHSVYGATKGGIVAMTRSWAIELAPHGITVNAISPGPIETEMFRSSNPPESPATKALLGAIPVGRIGLPADVAAAVAFFLSEDASFITGQMLNVCGGLSIASAPF